MKHIALIGNPDDLSDKKAEILPMLEDGDSLICVSSPSDPSLGRIDGLAANPEGDRLFCVVSSIFSVTDLAFLKSELHGRNFQFVSFDALLRRMLLNERLMETVRRQLDRNPFIFEFLFESPEFFELMASFNLERSEAAHFAGYSSKAAEHMKYFESFKRVSEKLRANPALRVPESV